MSKKIIFNQDARTAMKKGIDALADAVKVTLGPKGRNVIINQKYGPPHVTKDGVTVAKEISLADATENMGAQMLKEVASKTADIAGDGTTTATVLAQAIVTAGLKNVTAGANPMDLKKGIDKAVKAVVESLKKISKPIKTNEEIIQVGTISANSDEEIGRLLSEAMAKVGKEGVITIEEAKGIETTIEVVEGMQFNRGYSSPYFVNSPEKMETIYDNPVFLLTSKKLMDPGELVPLLEQTMKQQVPLIIIADEVSNDVTSFLVMNKMRGGLKICVVNAPSFGERKKQLIEDLSVATGGMFLDEAHELKINNVQLSTLGKAKRIIVSKDNCVIVKGNGNKKNIDERTAMLRNSIEKAANDFDKEKLQERLAKFTGGVAVINVGAATEIEMKEKKDRVDDALHATRAAVEEGIVPGGGVAYLRASEVLKEMKGANEDETSGIRIVMRALEEPLRQIVNNSGTVDGSIVIQKVKESKGSMGYNARTEVYEDLIVAGVIDPTKVSRVALENAASIAGMILTTECLLVDEPAPVPPIQPMQPMM